MLLHIFKLQILLCFILVQHYVKKIKSLRLGIREDGKVTFDNDKIDQMDRFTYLGTISIEDSWSSGNVQSRIAEAQVVFCTVEKSLKE